MKILIAAYSQTQLDTFLRNHPEINPTDVVRVRSILDLCATNNRFLYWLPNAGESMANAQGSYPQEIIDYWFSSPNRTRIIYEVKEEQVLGRAPFVMAEEIPCPR